MEINVEKMQPLIMTLKSEIENYEYLHSIFYNELSKNKFSWKDQYANAFFENVDKEKTEIKKFLIEINDVSNIYTYINESYITIGNKIYLDLENKETIINLFINYINEFDKIITKYKSFDINIEKEEKMLLYNEQQTLLNNKNNIIEIKNKFKNKIEKIEEIEQNINIKLDKIEIDLMLRNNSNNIVKDNNSSYMMVAVEVENSITRLKNYLKQEYNCLENIKKTLKRILLTYNTKNKKYLEKITIKLINKIDIIHNDHINNIILLNNNLENYKAIKNIVTQIKN